MAMRINESCINCGNCEPTCPNEAISAGANLYIVSSERCTECVGAFETPQCIDACPIPDCITVDPAHTESPDTLRARYSQRHPR